MKKFLTCQLKISTNDNDDEYLDTFEDIPEAQMFDETSPYNTDQPPSSVDSNLHDYSHNSASIKVENPDSKLACNLCEYKIKTPGHQIFM